MATIRGILCKSKREVTSKEGGKANKREKVKTLRVRGRWEEEKGRAGGGGAWQWSKTRCGLFGILRGIASGQVDKSGPAAPLSPPTAAAALWLVGRGSIEYRVPATR